MDTKGHYRDSSRSSRCYIADYTMKFMKCLVFANFGYLVAF